MSALLHRRSVVALALALATGTAACNRGGDDRVADRDTVGARTAPGTVGDARDGAFRVDDLRLGRAVDEQGRVTDETDDFRPNDTIYVSFRSQNGAATGNTNVVARWTFQDGQVVDETSQSVAAGGTGHTHFHVSRPSGWPAGEYRVAILVNGNEVASEDFEVEGARR